MSGTLYPMLDRFNRVTSSRWASYKGSGERDFYRVDIAYDHDSNILSAADRIHKNASGDRNFDVLYSHDDLGRLTRAEEGELDSGSITGRSRDERWLDSSGNLALSQTGNWLHRRLDLDGDGQFTGTDELDETNAFNLANELIERDINSSSTPDYEPSYNLAGHQIDDGKDYEYVYDAFGRLMEVRDRVSKDLVAAYRYNGLNFRIGWHSDVTDDTGGNPDGVVDEEDPWFWFCYDDRWRVVAVFRADDAHPKEVFVHHNAGLAGYGGSSYIDSVILRDRDTSTAWHEGIGEISVRDERVYYAQNWRGDVSALLTDTGSMIEWVKYSAYGVPYSLPAGDTDSSGTWDAADEGRIAAATSYDVRYDANLDGVVGDDDITHANSIAGGYQTLGRGVLSSPAVANRVGYAGYRYDPTFKGASRTIYHVRHRVYDADVGRWTRRDPLGYVDGMSLYEYVASRPVIGVDPRGTDTAVPGGGVVIGGGIGVVDDVAVGGGNKPTTPTSNPGANSWWIVIWTTRMARLRPKIDESCGASNPVADCLDDPAFQGAFWRYLVDCTSSSRGAVTIKCDSERTNSFHCGNNTINYRGTGCGSLAHEFLHAADYCRQDDDCEIWRNQRDNPEAFCEQWLCREARAAVFGSCCDPNNPWRRGRTWAQCANAMFDSYMKASARRCGRMSDADRRAAWNKCVPGGITEARACSGDTPAVE